MEPARERRIQAESQPAQPNLTWYIQVSVLVLGHVAGLVVAHDRAVALSSTPKVALRTQYAMLALMVLYTVGGMWILSIG